jgi:hypothetical protein
VSKKDTITIYWAPAPFMPDNDSWAMLYRDPEPVFDKLKFNNAYRGKMIACPATKDTLRNVYSFNSAIDDEFKLPTELMRSIAHTDEDNEILPSDSKLYIQKMRKSSIKNHANIHYNMSWNFFASEPVVARFTAPFFPTISPVKNSYLSTGQFDIGRWYRTFMLEYHIPVDAVDFSIKENDPLLFIEFLTDKKIEFKRYFMTPKLSNLAVEAANASRRYSKRKTLFERYKMAHGSKIPNIVLAEIRKNLIE